jgi:hypothetical protein
VIYLLLVRRSSKIALQLSWLLLPAVIVLAWRKQLALPDGDPSALVVATLAGPIGLGLVGDWVRERERRRDGRGIDLRGG